MQEIIRRCDLPVKKRGEMVPHGEQVNSDPTQFAVDGKPYEIDLCGTHRTEFDTLMAPFIAAATPLPSGNNGHAVRKALKGRKGEFTTKDVRKWAAEIGREVAPSGRLPNQVIEEYRTTHSV